MVEHRSHIQQLWVGGCGAPITIRQSQSCKPVRAATAAKMGDPVGRDALGEATNQIFVANECRAGVAARENAVNLLAQVVGLGCLAAQRLLCYSARPRLAHAALQPATSGRTTVTGRPNSVSLQWRVGGGVRPDDVAAAAGAARDGAGAWFRSRPRARG